MTSRWTKKELLQALAYASPGALATAVGVMGGKGEGKKKIAKAKKMVQQAQSGLSLLRSTIPAAISTKVQPNKPVWSMRGNNTVVTAGEQIADITGTAGFGVQRIQINPGLSVYPWLKQQARSWEKYKFLSLEFIYVPSTAVTTTTGTVYMAADYDPDDPEPADLSSLSAYETQVNSRTYESARLKLDQKRMFEGIQVKRVRVGPVGGTLQLYDPAFLTVATIDCPASPIGQLWVNYKIEFHSRITEPILRQPRDMAQYHYNSTVTVTDGLPKILTMNTTVRAPFSSMTGGVVTVQKGAYLVDWGCNVNDDTSEDFYGYLELLQDNASVTSPTQPVARDHFGWLAAAVKTDQLQTLGGTTYVTFTGTGTLSLSASLNGAAGVLGAGQQFIRIRAVS